MAKKTNETVTQYADHEVIMPVNRLAKAVTRAAPGLNPHDDLVARAEQALAGLSDEFASWMESECARLDEARRAIKRKGFSEERVKSLFHAAHDIKGEAATFGFPLVAPVAESLCRLLEYAPEPAGIPSLLLDQHVDAVRAIIREKAGDDDRTAQELAGELRLAADAFLISANHDRPDVLAAIAAPPLAP